MSSYDDFDNLSGELENEQKYKAGVEDTNVELETNVVELEGYLRLKEEHYDTADDVEWKLRYESKTAMNMHLSDEKGWLERELSELKWKCHEEEYPDVQNFKMETLTEKELIRLVKHMERMRTDCCTSLQETERLIEINVKQFRDLDEARKVYKSELEEAEKEVEQSELAKAAAAKERGTTPPLHSDAYTDWLDSKQDEAEMHQTASEEQDTKTDIPV